MRPLAKIAVFLAGLGAIGPANAANFAEKGDAAFLLGGINAYDDYHFQEFLKLPRAAPLRILYLHSKGGLVSEASNIARMVRKAGMATAVNAMRSPCESACTLIFSGGVRRLYFGAQNVVDGIGGDRGLGYHRGNDLGATGEGVREDPLTTDKMNALYKEMGSPRAAQYTLKVSFDKMYRISGATALKSGIATSLAEP